MKTKITQSLMMVLAGLGLLLGGSARADISLMDGAGPNGLYSTNAFIGPATNADGSFDTNTVATMSTPFTVTTNRNSVLVVELADCNHNPNNASPSFMTWSNNVTGATQTLTLTATESSFTYNYYWLNTYYLYSPNPGSGTLICVETNNIPAGSNTASISVTNAYFHMSMQAFSLQGVDTNYVPQFGGSGLAVATGINVIGPSLPNYGYWAAFCANDSNTGDTMTNSTVGSLFSPLQPSGTTYYEEGPVLDAGGYEVNAYGYTVNLLPKLTQFIATENSSGVGTQMSLEYTIFKPYDSFAGVYPTGVSATTNQNSQITVSWTAVGSGSPTNYIVWRSTQRQGPFTVAGNSTTTSFVNTGVATGVNYYYILQAQNAGGVSLYSMIIGGGGAGTTPATGEALGLAVGVPSAPQGVTGATGINSTLLSWGSQLGVTTFYIARSLTSGGESIVASTAGTASNYTDTAVTDGTKYYYEIAASNSFGLGPFSVEVSAVPAVTIFTNYIGLFNSQADMWTPENTNCSSYFVSSNDLFVSFYNAAGFMVPTPSGGVMDMEGEFAEQPAVLTNDIAGFTNSVNGVTKTYPYALNISGYQYLEMDACNIGNATNVWDNGGGGGVGQITPEFQMLVANVPTFEPGNNGQPFYLAINNGGQGGTNFVHFVIPLNLWSNYNLSTVSAARIEEVEPPGFYNYPATNSVAGTNYAMWLDVGFANIKLSGAPAWAPVFSNLNPSPSIGTGTPSVTLTGKVSGVVAGTNVYCWQGTPVSVTVQGLSTQTTAINDASGDFSITYTGTGSLPNGGYPITYSVPADMVELVGATNSATTLTVGVMPPPPTPIVTVSRSGSNLAITVANSASGYNYYLLTTTNLNSPIIWSTNTTTAGTGGAITNTVLINSSTPKQFFKYLAQ